MVYLRIFFFMLLLAISNFSIAQGYTIPAPTGSVNFAMYQTLPNGNFVLIDYAYELNGVQNVGAVHLYDGATRQLISTVSGTLAGDYVGIGGVTILPNGNFVIRSPQWNNQRGAVTWVNAETGLTGEVSSSNSLVGSTNMDAVGGNTIYVLTNGNYIVSSQYWNNYRGMVALCNGTTGTSGIVSSSNSLVGSQVGDYLGGAAPTVLSNGNYVVSSTRWGGGRGIVLWCDGVAGRTGVVNGSDGLTGTSLDDGIGNYITALSNGSYVICSPNWNNGGVEKVGAVTLCAGSGPTTGEISTSNSFYGGTELDQIGYYGATVLGNGNFIFGSPFCDINGKTDAGAVTWCSASGNTSGAIGSANSLVGSHAFDRLGTYDMLFNLSGGKWALCAYEWDNDLIEDAGAVFLGDGITAAVGELSSSNSLTGMATGDKIGLGGIWELANGNYVISSPDFNTLGQPKVGAVTWWAATDPLTGEITALNSLIGQTAGDRIGTGVTPLSNGNFVVSSPDWDNGMSADVGIVTILNGNSATTGVVDPNNSVIGFSASDRIGQRITPLPNGDFVILSPFWANGSAANAGAATLVRGDTPLGMVVSASNSLVGSNADDQVGIRDPFVLPNSDFCLPSIFWHNGGITDAGAFTFFSVSNPGIGEINSCNSIVGGQLNSGWYFRAAQFLDESRFIVSLMLENKVIVYGTNDAELFSSGGASVVNVSEGGEVPLFVNDECSVFGRLVSSGAHAVRGVVNLKAWKEPAVITSGTTVFVGRHTEITPAQDPSSATALLTLYFDQSDFDQFNNYPGVSSQLPTSGEDVSGIANIRIHKYGGQSQDNSGLPQSYSGVLTVIDPDDNLVVWNEFLSRWEIKFDVQGFSGFFLSSEGSTLPVTFLTVYPEKLDNSVKVQWTVTDESQILEYRVLRSTDGVNFTAVGYLQPQLASGVLEYEYLDVNVLLSGSSKFFYQIVAVDIDRSKRFSRIVSVDNTLLGQRVLAYPNPVIDLVKIRYPSSTASTLTVTIYSSNGMVVERLQSEVIPQSAGNFEIALGHLLPGIYFIEVSDGQRRDRVKIRKQ